MSIPDRQRIVITGMAINTPLGDTLETFRDGLFAGRSAITRWRGFDTSRILFRVGADLSDYEPAAKLAWLAERVPEPLFRRLHRLLARVPWSTKHTMLLAVDAWVDAAAEAEFPADRIAAIVAGHNLNAKYQFDNQANFVIEPDDMDPLLALHSLDTDHAGCVSEVLGILGPIFTVGAACASGNTALRCAIDEIRHHDMDGAVVVGAMLDLAPLPLHSMALMGAISCQSFNDEPQRASRPYDVRREGFVPAHGGGALFLESLTSAQKRGARIYAEVLSVEANSDGSHLTKPSEEGQARLIERVLRVAGIAREEVDYVNAHATSTPLGDLVELRAIKRVFGSHAYRLKINATKSMLGHTCWAAAIVETIAAVLQMNASRLHPSINIDQLDPEVDLDVCADGAIDHPVRCVLKNSFGFGGINCVSLLRSMES